MIRFIREGYIRLISIEKSTINLTPPIVFLFGGKIYDPQDKQKSVRSILYNHIVTNHNYLTDTLVIPEDFKDWLNDSNYPDLLTFESDLAETSSLVIITLESPGAIAELGSFSVHKELKKKIMLIICEKHHNQNSFIVLGPVRQLINKNVLAYPYNYQSLEGTLNNFISDIVNNINTYLANMNKTESFNIKNNGHIALLIYELTTIFHALKLNEIQKYLQILSINRSQKEVKRLLFLLQKLDFIKKSRYGNNEFFLPLKKDQRLNLSSKDKKKLFDRNSANIGSAQYYTKTVAEEMRKLAITNK